MSEVRNAAVRGEPFDKALLSEVEGLRTNGINQSFLPFSLNTLSHFNALALLYAQEQKNRSVPAAGFFAYNAALIILNPCFYSISLRSPPS